MKKDKVKDLRKLNSEFMPSNDMMAVIGFVILREVKRGEAQKIASDPRLDSPVDQIRYAYSNGLCGNLAMILQHCFPIATRYYVYTDDLKYSHIMTKYNGLYYDIKGAHTKEDLEADIAKKTNRLHFEKLNIKTFCNTNGYYYLNTQPDMVASKKFLQIIKENRYAKIGIKVVKKSTEQSGD